MILRESWPAFPEPPERLYRVGWEITISSLIDNYWNEWANRNYGDRPEFNIQNQSDVADWPWPRLDVWWRP